MSARPQSEVTSVRGSEASQGRRHPRGAEWRRSRNWGRATRVLPPPPNAPKEMYFSCSAWPTGKRGRAGLSKGRGTWHVPSDPAGPARGPFGKGGVSGAWGHWLSGRMVCVQFKGRASLPSPQNAAIHGERNGLDHEIRDGQRGYSLPRPTPQRNHSYPKKRPRAQRVTPGSRRTSGPRGPGIPRGCTRLSSSGRPAEVSCLGGGNLRERNDIPLGACGGQHFRISYHLYSAVCRLHKAFACAHGQPVRSRYWQSHPHLFARPLNPLPTKHHFQLSKHAIGKRLSWEIDLPWSQELSYTTQCVRTICTADGGLRWGGAGMVPFLYRRAGNGAGVVAH